ncbi:hypothetical protein GCM10009681_36070 [Luedemannella helvata]|uniref:Type II secretion system protein GspF domain-containing protein n=1 Tax=Luedemannella helvata TaxID=349315 RepID=A0ABP4WWB5_9ACTN
MAAGAALGYGLAGWVGLAAGVVAAAVGVAWLARQEPAAVRAEREAVRAELAYADALLAAALRAGAPPDRAAAEVADALGGPVGRRLGRVARALRLGATAEEAWAYLGDDPAVARVVRAATRAQHRGAAFAEALTRVADDLRAADVAAAEAAGQRAAVLIVLPLGLCFLPAFVLAGLVPVVVAVLGDVLPH